mmetsp:Transcript_15481/g.41573  ORF Transcript_15481/g.41573 Transcript_15481/m.41573 type:complete len:85 (-) Transcript_15481:763-1017(-)
MYGANWGTECDVTKFHNGSEARLESCRSRCSIDEVLAKLPIDRVGHSARVAIGSTSANGVTKVSYTVNCAPHKARPSGYLQRYV